MAPRGRASPGSSPWSSSQRGGQRAVRALTTRRSGQRSAFSRSQAASSHWRIAEPALLVGSGDPQLHRRRDGVDQVGQRRRDLPQIEITDIALPHGAAPGPVRIVKLDEAGPLRLEGDCQQRVRSVMDGSELDRLRDRHEVEPVDHPGRTALEPAPQAHEVVGQAEGRHSSAERVQLGVAGRIQGRRQVQLGRDLKEPTDRFVDVHLNRHDSGQVERNIAGELRVPRLTCTPDSRRMRPPRSSS